MKKFFKKYNSQAGMSYVELIVVLSIFSVISGVTVYNYGLFQSNIDVKTLAQDIALKIVEAQKSSLSGILPSGSSSGWKPSYGVHFDANTPTSFIYFADLDNDRTYNESPLETIQITKGDHIARIDRMVTDSKLVPIKDSVTMTFQRPDSGIVFTSSGVQLTDFDYIQITIESTRSQISTIKVFPSGRIQVN